MSHNAVDILTDRKCFKELDFSLETHSQKTNSLSSVNERMSEEALDDCHAFSDLSRNGSLHDKHDRKVLPPVNERISKEKLDDSDAFKQITMPERRASFSNSTSMTVGDSDISCNLETFEEVEEEDEDVEDDMEPKEKDELEKKKLSHDVFFDLLETVSSPVEKRELKESRRLSFSC